MLLLEFLAGSIVVAFFAVLVVELGIAAGAAAIAYKKGRSAVGWFFLTLLGSFLVPLAGGVIVILIVAFMAKVEPAAEVGPPPVIPPYDAAAWAALVASDSDVAMSKAQLAPYGDHYVAELAVATLAGGRNNLAANTNRLLERARAERPQGRA